MDLSAILLFTAVLAVAIATPLWLAAAVFGLAALADQAHGVMMALKYLSAAYLVYLAYRRWAAPAINPEQRAPARRRRLGPVVGGLAMAISNPKTMLFYLALLPNLVPFTGISLATFAELVVLLTVVYSGALTAYMISASYARRLITSPRAVRYANRGSAVVMAGTAAIVASRS
jgi:threonine/homoserine/homoserine lactone efflux protein